MGEREAQKPCETVKLTGSPMRRDYLLPGIQVLKLKFRVQMGGANYGRRAVPPEVILCRMTFCS